MRKKQPYTVININKYGEVFDPSTYLVKRSENPELYEFLAQVGRKHMAEKVQANG